jgi:hypothetical protein
VEWSTGEETWEDYDVATADGAVALRDYYIQHMPADIWQDALDQRSECSFEMVDQLSKLKKLLDVPSADAGIMAQFKRVENSMQHMSLLTQNAATFAQQNRMIRWRIRAFNNIAGLLDDLPTGTFFKSYEEFNAALHARELEEQKSFGEFLKEKRLARIAALCAEPERSGVKAALPM